MEDLKTEIRNDIQAMVKGLEAVGQEVESTRRDARQLQEFLKRAREVIESAYQCEEWLQFYRTERTDETEWMIRDYLDEFGNEY